MNASPFAPARRGFAVRRLLPLLVVGAALGTLNSAALAQSAAHYDGMVLPFREVVVSAPVQSTIEEVFVKEGDRVTTGQPLARLYSKLEELDMQRMKAAREKREFDYRGAKRLFEDQIIPEDKALEARIELELAQLQYAIAAENVRLRAINSPLDGLVVEKLREAGESVTATQPLFRIVDISRVYVQFFIKAEDLKTFATGQTLGASFADLNDGQPFTGEIDFIDPRVDAASGLLRVRVLIQNPQSQIKAGMRAIVAAP